MSHHQALPTSQRLIPFACAGDPAGVHTEHHIQAAGGVDSEALDRQITETYRDIADEAGRDLHFPTGRALAETLGYPADLLGMLPADAVNSFAGVGYHLGLACLLPADLWAACIAGASQRDLYLADIAVAGLELQVIQANPGYRFSSERARRTSDKHGAHSVSLLALKPVPASRHISNPNPGGGARVAQATREEGPTNTTTTRRSK